MGIRTCRELLALEYGSELQTRIQESIVTVGPSAVTLVSGNGARIWLAIQNNPGPVNVYISTLSSVAVNAGILVVGGGFQSFKWKSDGDLPTLAFYAISAAPGTTITVIEQILTGEGL
jgi:hypothetical protein